jgi:hypothetical protein
VPVRVRRSFSDVGGKLILGTPKSHHARSVPIPRFLALMLATLIMGKQPDDLVFTTPSGAPLRLSNWRRSVFLPARKQAEISEAPAASSMPSVRAWPTSRQAIAACQAEARRYVIRP